MKGTELRAETTSFLMKEAARDFTKVENLFLSHFTNLGETLF